MEQIVQLKSMRDEALVRLQNNPDYKLVNSLDALIQDLESVLSPEVAASDAVSEEIVEEKISQSDEIATAEEANASDALSADSDDSSEVSNDETIERDETLEELAAESPDEVSSAIEALEAELSQNVTSSDGESLTSDTSIN